MFKAAASFDALSMYGYKNNSRDTVKEEGPVISANSIVFRALNGTPSQNMTKLIEYMGGIDRIICPMDIVLIKPNVQWWNQGAPNIAALKTFIEMIINHPKGFNGEIIIGENIHRGSAPYKHAGWSTPFQRNSDAGPIVNYNGLCEHFKRKYGNKFSSCHWIDVKDGGRRVYSPADGCGYIWCDGTNNVPLIVLDNGLDNDSRREVIMSYPVFTTDRGTIIDFKHGVWNKGTYTQQPVRFINFAACNHHSLSCGATMSIKNYLGISDLSGGPDPFNDGRLTGRYYNFHSFPLNKWSPGPVQGMLGAEIGHFIKTIRKADLNIVTAEWIGLASRIGPPVSHTRAVLASTDPVALDYHLAKYLLYANSHASLHDPDNFGGPLYQYLSSCARYIGGVVEERRVDVRGFDCAGNIPEENAKSQVI